MDMLDGRRIYFFCFGSTVPFAGIETDSSWKSIEHHELHRPTNGMFAQAGGGWQLATLADGVILVVPIGSMYSRLVNQPPPNVAPSPHKAGYFLGGSLALGIRSPDKFR